MRVDYTTHLKGYDLLDILLTKFIQRLCFPIYSDIITIHKVNNVIEKSKGMLTVRM